MTTLTAADGLPAIGIRATKAAPVIVATDGEAQSDGALALGKLLAGSSDSFRLVSVLRPMPVITDASGMVASPGEIDRTRRSDLHRQVIDQTTRQYGAPYRPEVHDGDPAAVIARLAHRANASLIVCGLGRHDVVDRILGDETALRVVRMADVPVLAVPAHQREAPRTVVVACDFSETSHRAARLAASLAAPSATIYLVHVAPRDHTRYEWDGWGKAYRQDALDALRQTKQLLRVEADTIVQAIMLQGDTAEELLRFAKNVNADLIATGSHGHGFIARMLIGSVATRILRAATCGVAVVPLAAAASDERTTAHPPMGRTVPRDDWAEALAAFSERNAGRRALLEVDDADLGAQAQVLDYEFRGADYDARDQRISLMFGPDSGRAHLTRGIAEATGVDLLQERDGHDIAMRIKHGKGQTLLTFVE